MKRVYLYIFACMIIGTLMLFKGSLRKAFSENLNIPTQADQLWTPPKKKQYQTKVILELHYFTPRRAYDLIKQKIDTLHQNNNGIYTLLLSGSPKLPTNIYLRELAKEDWGIEEIRLHNTESINIHAFLNLIKANSEIKRVLIWKNTWKQEKIIAIQKLLPSPTGLKLMQE